jgi:adenylate cyclase
LLEGSVRKAGSRVRIIAELLDCASGQQLWAERFDRDLTDIFAIQDEISKAIVSALQLKLLPKEKKAIEHRGTSKPDAYNLYLLARQHWISGNAGDRRRDELVVRICRQATTIDPGYANAWALMALAQCELNLMFGLRIDGREAAERALELDPGVPEALCVKARYMAEDGEIEQAISQVEAVLRDQPDSWQANKEMAYLIFRSGRVEDSVPYFEKAVKLMDTDYHDAGMLMTCYEALGDLENMRRIGKVTFERVEKAVAQDPSNGTAMAMGAGALGAMGDADRAREWIDRTMLVDPDNINARYNLACSLVSLGDLDGAIDLLGPYFDEVEPLEFRHSDVDPDMAPLRSLPRYQEMRESARGRLGLPASAANQ